MGMKWLLTFLDSIAVAREATMLVRQNKFEEAKRLMLGQPRV
jgi:hypothetical protein